jgi:hypothetical protein
MVKNREMNKYMCEDGLHEYKINCTAEMLDGNASRFESNCTGECNPWVGIALRQRTTVQCLRIRQTGATHVQLQSSDGSRGWVTTQDYPYFDSPTYYALNLEWAGRGTVRLNPRFLSEKHQWRIVGPGQWSVENLEWYEDKACTILATTSFISSYNEDNTTTGFPFNPKCPRGVDCLNWVGFTAFGDSTNDTNISCVRIKHGSPGARLTIQWWGGPESPRKGDWVTELITGGVREDAWIWTGMAPYGVRLRPMWPSVGSWRVENLFFYSEPDCTKEIVGTEVIGSGYADQKLGASTAPRSWEAPCDPCDVQRPNPDGGLLNLGIPVLPPDAYIGIGSVEPLPEVKCMRYDSGKDTLLLRDVVLERVNNTCTGGIHSPNVCEWIEVNQWHDLGIQTTKLTDPIANPERNQQWELRYPAPHFPDGGITEMFFFADHDCTLNIPAPEVTFAGSEQFGYDASQAVDEDFDTLWQAVKPKPADGPGWNETDTWIRAHFKLPIMTNCVQTRRSAEAIANSSRPVTPADLRAVQTSCDVLEGDGGKPQKLDPEAELLLYNTGRKIEVDGVGMVPEQQQICTFSAWSGGIVDGLYDRITTTNRITAQKYCRQSYAPYRNLFQEVNAVWHKECSDAGLTGITCPVPVSMLRPGYLCCCEELKRPNAETSNQLATRLTPMFQDYAREAGKWAVTFAIPASIVLAGCVVFSCFQAAAFRKLRRMRKAAEEKRRKEAWAEDEEDDEKPKVPLCKRLFGWICFPSITLFHFPLAHVYSDIVLGISILWLGAVGIVAWPYLFYCLIWRIFDLTFGNLFRCCRFIYRKVRGDDDEEFDLSPKSPGSGVTQGTVSTAKPTKKSIMNAFSNRKSMQTLAQISNAGGPMAAKRRSQMEAKREKNRMKLDALVGGAFMIAVDVVQFSLHVAVLEWLDPYRAEGGDLCELVPFPIVCQYLRLALSAPFTGYMRPECLGVRAAWAFWHITTYLVFHVFCFATDAHAVSAACMTCSLERLKYGRFLKGALSSTVLYFTGLMTGIQCYRSIWALTDWSCVTDTIEMEQLEIPILFESESGYSEMRLLIAACSAPLALVLMLPLIPKDLPETHALLAYRLHKWVGAISEREMLKVEYEWAHCTFEAPKKKKTGRLTSPKAQTQKPRKTRLTRLTNAIMLEDEEQEDGPGVYRKLRGRLKCYSYKIEKRIRAYGRIFDGKRWPVASIARARARMFGLPLVAAGQYGFLVAVFANCICLTFRYFPSDEAQDVIRSVRSHGPILCILETVARLLPFGAAAAVRPGRDVSNLVYAGAGIRAIVMLCGHHADSGDTILGDTQTAPPPPPPPPPPPV